MILNSHLLLKSTTVTIVRLLFIGLILTLSTSALAQVQVPKVRLTLWVPPTLNTDTFGQVIEPQLTNMGNVNLTAPIRIDFELPPEVSYVGFSSSSATNWQCSGSGQIASCNYVVPLTTSTFNTSWLGLNIDVSGNLPIPGTSEFRATVSNNSQLPAPDTANCVTSSSFSGISDNGCLVVQSQHFKSFIGVVDAWSHSSPIFVVGTEHQFTTRFEQRGFGLNNGQVTVKILLPPGLAFNRTQGHIPLPSAPCTAAAPTAEGQIVTCTYAQLADGLNAQTFLFTTIVDVTDEVAVPGPVPIFATVGNAQQPLPPFADCALASPPVGCGSYEIPTKAASMSKIDILDISHTPAIFETGKNGTVRVTFTNLGDLAAEAITLKLATPPGFDFVNAAGAVPAATCVSDDDINGEIVTCNFVTGFAPGANNGAVNLNFNISSAAAASSRVVASIGDNSNPAPGIPSCSADPDAVGCDDHFIEVTRGWIFCDGFESQPQTCGE